MTGGAASVVIDNGGRAEHILKAETASPKAKIYIFQIGKIVRVEKTGHGQERTPVDNGTTTIGKYLTVGLFFCRQSLMTAESIAVHTVKVPGSINFVRLLHCENVGAYRKNARIVHNGIHKVTDTIRCQYGIVI